MIRIIIRDFWKEISIDGEIKFKGNDINVDSLIKILNISIPIDKNIIAKPEELLEILHLDYEIQWDVEN